jgi:hypothetical protein
LQKRMKHFAKNIVFVYIYNVLILLCC